MPNPVPAGSDVSAGTYRCTSCGDQIDVGSSKSLPPAPPAATANGRRSRAATASTTRTRIAKNEL